MRGAGGQVKGLRQRSRALASGAVEGGMVRWTKPRDALGPERALYYLIGERRRFPEAIQRPLGGASSAGSPPQGRPRVSISAKTRGPLR